MSLLWWQRWKKLSVFTAIGLRMVLLLQEQIKQKELKRRRGENSMMKTKSGIFREILQGIGIIVFCNYYCFFFTFFLGLRSCG